MADQIVDTAQLVLDRVDIQSLSELHAKKAFSLPQISEIHTVFPGIVAPTQIGIDGRMPHVGTAKSGCAFTAANGEVPLLEKTWTPAKFEIAMEQCVDNLDNTFWNFHLAAGKDNPDLTAAESFQAWYADKFDEASLTAVLRHVWFGDTAIANYNDSPAGFLTNGISEGLYNVIDGLWKQLFAIGTADANRLNAISENGNSTYATQALAAGKANTVFAAMRAGADDRLYEDEGAVILCTKSMALNYTTYLKSIGVDPAWKAIQGGIKVIDFDGVPVVMLPFWDRIINAHFNNGTKWFRPHRAVYVNKMNLGISLDDNESFASYREWYSDDDGQYRIRALWKMDAKVFDDEAVQLAY